MSLLDQAASALYHKDWERRDYNQLPLPFSQIEEITKIYWRLEVSTHPAAVVLFEAMAIDRAKIDVLMATLEEICNTATEEAIKSRCNEVLEEIKNGKFKE